MTEMTEKQRAAYMAARERMMKEDEERARVPTQRTRAIAQGVTLGTSDEIEARARAILSGQSYEDALAEIRGGLKEYQRAYPFESLAYEAGGAIAPAFVPGGQAPTLARMIARGAAEGSAYAFGTGEGGFASRASRVPGGALAGGVGAGVVGGATRAIGAGVTALTDAARRVAGGRGSTVVENEIQRLVKQTGKTADQIADDIIAGRVLAENQTIRAAVRALRSGGGEASRIIEEGIANRPTQMRTKAMEAIRGGLSDPNASSALVAQRTSDDAARAAERMAYSQFEGVPAPDDAVAALAAALRRVPSAAKEVEIALKAATGKAPFFEIAEDGAMTFTRRPTIAEVERVRRSIGDRASAFYREGLGGAGEAVSGVEKGMRSIIDMSIPELATTRAQAAAIRAQRDAFEAGRTALAGDVNEKLLQFSKLADPEQVQAYRAGLMAALEARGATGSRQSMIRNLVNEETKEGRILREVFPQDDLAKVIDVIDVAKGSQEAANYIMGGSATAETMMEAGRQGLGISALDITGVLSGDPTSMAKVAQEIAGRFTRGLTDAEKARVAKLLVSENADLVKRAIQDDGALAALQKQVEKLANKATRGAARGGAVTSSGFGADITERMGRGLLSQ